MIKQGRQDATWTSSEEIEINAECLRGFQPNQSLVLALNYCMGLKYWPLGKPKAPQNDQGQDWLLTKPAEHLAQTGVREAWCCYYYLFFRDGPIPARRYQNATCLYKHYLSYHSALSHTQTDSFAATQLTNTYECKTMASTDKHASPAAKCVYSICLFPIS